MTKPDWPIDDEFPEPEAIVPVVTPLPTVVPGSTGAESPQAGGLDTPGLPAAGIFRPFPLPPVDLGEGGRRAGDTGSDTGGGMSAEALAGKFDAFVGIVRTVDYSAAHETLGMKQGITVERVDVRWDPTTNKPLPTVTPSPAVGSSNVVDCKPWPGMHDQELYHVVKGDIVTVLRGADGLNWYLKDDLPFVGVVVAWDDDDVTEEYNGGTKAKGDTLGIKVRQQAISANPSSALSTFADLETIADAWVKATAYIVDDVVIEPETPFATYRCKEAHTSSAAFATDSAKWEADNIVIHRYVNVLTADNMAHGYRVGDEVLIVRRGMYLFALPTRQSFLAATFATGPDSEADFADEHYWVKEQDVTTTYSGGSGNQYTISAAARSATDPTGSDGRKGRWVDTINLAERPDATHLLGAGVLVEVTMWADASEEVCYTFDHAPPNDQLPSGLIVMWSGSIANIPTGWLLCDGTNSTPDLRGRFVVGSYASSGVSDGGGAGDLGDTDDYAAPGETGGYAWHGISENNHPDHDDHSHILSTIQTDAAEGSGLHLAQAPGGAVTGLTSVQFYDTASTLTQRHGGTVHSWTPVGQEVHAYDDTDNRPSWYSVAYIMKT